MTDREQHMQKVNMYGIKKYISRFNVYLSDRE